MTGGGPGRFSPKALNLLAEAALDGRESVEIPLGDLLADYSDWTLEHRVYLIGKSLSVPVPQAREADSPEAFMSDCRTAIGLALVLWMSELRAHLTAGADALADVLVRHWQPPREGPRPDDDWPAGR